MRDCFEITCSDYPEIKLISAGTQHNDLLREWKNKNRMRFFFQEMITPEMQEKWFSGYLDREDDCMLMVCNSNNEPVGCLAFRERDGKYDLYNIIRGVQTQDIKISDAMRIMLAYIYLKYGDVEIVCDVLSDNPAKQWYERIGFKVQEDCGEYYVLRFDALESLPHLETENIKGLGKC